jgi:hypothetical protein
MKKKILIYGSGSDGRKVFRKFYKKYNIICFIDKDPSKKKLFNLNIYKPNIIKNKYPENEILIFGRYSKSILEDINKYKIKNPFIILSKKDVAPSKKYLQNREKKTIESLRYVLQILEKYKCKYVLSASSLLAIFRNQYFSYFSDVDILIDVKFLPVLKKFNKKFNIKFNFYKKTKIIRNVTICSKLTNAIDEPAIIDLTLVYKKNYKHIIYTQCKTKFVNKKYLITKNKKIFPNFQVKIPLYWKSYLEHKYGKKWFIEDNYWTDDF